MYKWFYRSLFFTLPAGFFLRVVQYYSVVDADTGYFRDTFFSQAVNLYLVLSAALYIALLFVPGKTKPARAKGARRLYTPFETAVLCICSAFGVVTAFAAPGHSGFFGFLMGLLLLGCAAAFTLLWLDLKQINRELWLKLLLLSPVIYYIMRLIFTFEAYTQVANISSYMLTLFSAGFLALFSMNFAKLVFQDGSKKTLLFLGAMALSGLTVSSLPSLVVLILGFAYQMDQSIIHPFSQLFDLAMGVFVLQALYKLCVSGRPFAPAFVRPTNVQEGPPKTPEPPRA